jgi:hypothetical protein
MSKVQVYICFHASNPTQATAHEILLEAVWSMKRLTKEPYDLAVTYWTSSEVAYVVGVLRSRLPKETRLLHCERQNPDLAPALRNTALVDAYGQGRDTRFVLLDADMGFNHFWLQAWREDLERAEKLSGEGNAVVVPRYAPFRWPDRDEFKLTPDYWAWVKTGKTNLSPKEIAKWATSVGLTVSEDGFIDCRKGGEPVQSPHGLMAFMGRAKVLERFGLFDESFSGWGYDDDDMALRAISAGVGVYESQRVWLGHIVSLLFSVRIGKRQPVPGRQRGTNDHQLLQKWLGDPPWQCGPAGLWEYAKTNRPVEDGPFYEVPRCKPQTS